MYHHDMCLPVDVENVEKLSTFFVDNSDWNRSVCIITICICLSVWKAWKSYPHSVWITFPRGSAMA